MKKHSELSLVIPFYNEGNNVNILLNNLIQNLNKEKIDYQIMAVDNGSRDDTAKFIDSFCKKTDRVKKVTVKVNQGYGFGITTGLSACDGKYIGYLWGDNEIPVEATIAVFKKLKNQNLHLCKITRKRRKSSLFREVQSFFYNSMMRILFGVRSTDVNGCPKIMKNEVYKSLNIKSKDWFIDPEIMIKCKRKLYKVGEVPVISVKRREGTSNVNWKTVFEFIKNIIKCWLGVK